MSKVPPAISTSGRFTRSDYHTVSAAVLEAVRPLEERFGVRFQLGRGVFGSTVTIKLEGARVGDDGMAETAERIAFRNHASLFGLDPKDLDRTFRSDGTPFTIVGLNPKARKNVVLAQNVRTGKEYVFPADYVKFQLATSDR